MYLHKENDENVLDILGLEFEFRYTHKVNVVMYLSMQHVWDYYNQRCVRTLDGHTCDVSAVCFRPEFL